MKWPKHIKMKSLRTKVEEEDSLDGFQEVALLIESWRRQRALSNRLLPTLDPGMREVIYSGGDINVVVTSLADVKTEAVKDAFRQVFGKATIRSMESHPNIAPQPVGFTAAFKGAEERIDLLRQNGMIHEHQATVSIENFIAELLPDRWFDMGCLILRDPANSVELTTFTQATPVPSEYVLEAQDRTPQDYDRRWSGLAVTVGQVIQAAMPHVDHADWHRYFTGVSRQDMICSAARVLANMYKDRLPMHQEMFHQQ